MKMLLAAALAALSLATSAQAAPSYGARLEGFEYPYPQQRFKLNSQRQALEMVSTLIVRTAFSYHEFGLASALAVVLFLVIFALAATQIALMDKE